MRVELVSTSRPRIPFIPDTAWGYFDQASFAQLLSLREDVAAGKCTPGCVRARTPPLVHGRGDRRDAHRRHAHRCGVSLDRRPSADLRSSASMSLPTGSGVEDTAYVLNARLKETAGAVLSVLKSRVDQRMPSHTAVGTTTSSSCVMKGACPRSTRALRSRAAGPRHELSAASPGLGVSQPRGHPHRLGCATGRPRRCGEHRCAAEKGTPSLGCLPRARWMPYAH